MATALSNSTVISLPIPRARSGVGAAITTNAQQRNQLVLLSFRMTKLGASYAAGRRRSTMKVFAASAPTPPGIISEKVSESIKQAEEACAGDPASGECVAAWDEVEELSAAASHARDKAKGADADPLEVYCKDNPETDECRTYDD